MSTQAAPRWADYCLERLAALCRLRSASEPLAADATKRLIQKAVFSVYLDCVEAGVQWSAREVLAEWAPQARRPAPVESRAR